MIDDEAMLRLHKAIEASPFGKLSSVKGALEGLGIAALGLAPTIVEGDRIPDGSKQIGERLSLPINDAEATMLSVWVYLANGVPGIVIQSDRREEPVYHQIYHPLRRQIEAAGYLQPVPVGA